VSSKNGTSVSFKWKWPKLSKIKKGERRYNFLSYQNVEYIDWEIRNIFEFSYMEDESDWKKKFTRFRKNMSNNNKGSKTQKKKAFYIVNLWYKAATVFKFHE